MTFDVILAGVSMPGPATPQGHIVLPAGIVCSGGDPEWFRLEQRHDNLFDLYPEQRPFGIDAFWNRAPIYAMAPPMPTANRRLGSATDSATFQSAVPLDMGPQVPSDRTASY